MTERFTREEHIPERVAESLRKYGSLTVRPGDIVARLIVVPKSLLKLGQEPVSDDVCWVESIKHDENIPFVSTPDFDPAGRFASWGMNAVSVDQELNTATVLIVEPFDDGVVHMRKVVGHAETKEEYIEIRRSLVGDVPAGYVHLRGTPLEPRQEDVPVGPLKFGFKLRQ